MTDIETLKADANANAKMLREYLRKTGLLDETLEPVRDYTDEREEVLLNALIAADYLARRLATL